MAVITLLEKFALDVLVLWHFTYLGDAIVGCGLFTSVHLGGDGNWLKG